VTGALGNIPVELPDLLDIFHGIPLVVHVLETALAPSNSVSIWGEINIYIVASVLATCVQNFPDFPSAWKTVMFKPIEL